MACLNPLRGWMSKVPSPKSGKSYPVFKMQDGLVDVPVEVPCGHCRFCNMKKAADWATRAEKESKMHSASSFITLTYDDDHLPLGAGSRSTLSKRDWQLFMKRLRREFPECKMRFISCGEYGDKTGRAHYHGLIFGWMPPDFVPFGKKGLGTSAILARIWGQGFVVVGNVTWNSAAYVAGYVRKKFNGARKLAEYSDREPPFGLQSRRPGIGSDYYDKFRGEMYPAGTVVVGEGKVRPTPRYFDDKFLVEDPEAHRRMKLKRRLDAAYAEGLKPDNHLEAKLANLKARDFAREPGDRS